MYLNDLLKTYEVDNNEKIEIREKYRKDVETCLRNAFRFICEKITIVYGGSLAKDTAISDSSDVDILCYLSSDCALSVEEIYKEALKALTLDGFILKAKNSAICVTGHSKETPWDKTIDVVPGKFIDNDEGDVFLWQNRSQKKLKTNPAKQINKIKNSNSKDLIKLIKIYRACRGFELKSFYLEIFCIDVVEKEFGVGDDLLDKLVKFSRHYNDFDSIKIYDPANSANDLSDIHTQYEFEIIKERLKELFEIVSTDNKNAILNLLLGGKSSPDKAYEDYASEIAKRKGNSFSSNSLTIYQSFPIYVEIYDEKSKIFLFDSLIYPLAKGKHLRFSVRVNRYSIKISKCEWIITNAGYEARKKGDLRGESTSVPSITRDNFDYYYKEEHTKYYGDHFVQARLTTNTNRVIYTEKIRVKIRD